MAQKIKYSKSLRNEYAVVHARALDLLQHHIVNEKVPIFVKLTQYDDGPHITGFRNVFFPQRNILKDYDGQLALHIPSQHKIIMHPLSQKIYVFSVGHETAHPITGKIIQKIKKGEKKIPSTFGELARAYNYLWLIGHEKYFQFTGDFFEGGNNSETSTMESLKFRMDEFYADLTALYFDSQNIIHRKGEQSRTLHLLNPFLKGQKNSLMDLLAHIDPSNIESQLDLLVNAATYAPAWAAHRLLEELGSMNAIVDKGYLKLPPEELWTEILAPLPLH